MKIWIFVLSFGIGLIGCGEHRQEAFNSKDFQKKRDTEETDPKKLVFGAIAKGELNEVKTYIEKSDVPVDLTDSEGKTLLIKAIQARQYSIVDYLIEKGADTEKADNDDKKPLSYAADDAILQSLLKREQFSRDSLSKTLMEQAVPNDNVNLVRWLLEKGADPNGHRPKKSTPLIELAIKLTVEVDELGQIARMLVAHPETKINATRRGKTAIMVLCSKRHKPAREQRSLVLARILLTLPDIDLSIKTRKPRRGNLPREDCLALARRYKNSRLADLILAHLSEKKP